MAEPVPLPLPSSLARDADVPVTAGRCMALDVGDRRIGVAVSDPLRILASPLVTLTRGTLAGDVAAVASLVAGYEVAVLVVGLPLLPSGDRGEQADKTEHFVTALGPLVSVPIVRWDESYSTVEATSRRTERRAKHSRAGSLGRSRGSAGHPDRLDAEAAAVILEEWMRAASAGDASPDGTDTRRESDESD